MLGKVMQYKGLINALLILINSKLTVNYYTRVYTGSSMSNLMLFHAQIQEFVCYKCKKAAYFNF